MNLHDSSAMPIAFRNKSLLWKKNPGQLIVYLKIQYLYYC